ncbi:MAG: arsenate reductase [Firmicutes bacterium]|nr:arsenate reductase [Alicyclobacillaceae bacterium]MCL6497834.1 arsenate reductase [Bacillota bacterium]
MIAAPLTVDELSRLAELAGGVPALVSSKSPKAKQLNPPPATATAWLEAMAAEPRLIRRPILVTDHGTAVGFDPARWEALLAAIRPS